jgi:hypothetical protein
VNAIVVLETLRRGVLHLALLALVAMTVLFLELDARGVVGGVLLLLVLATMTAGIPFAVVLLGVRRRQFGLLGYALFLYAWVIGALYAGGRLGGIKYENSVAKGTTIARALERFYAKNGAFPQDLEALVPEQLLVVPATDMGLFTTTRYFYRLNPDGSYELSFWRRGFARATYFPQFDSWGQGDE